MHYAMIILILHIINAAGVDGVLTQPLVDTSGIFSVHLFNVLAISGNSEHFLVFLELKIRTKSPPGGKGVTLNTS
jgi:hypothetical protein